MYSLGAVCATSLLVACLPTHAFVGFSLHHHPGTSGADVRRGATRAATRRLSYAPTNVQEVWDNHFAAFGGKDIEKILLDYDENSVITTYDQTSDKKSVFRGVEGARSLFGGLFGMLSDTSDLAAPLADVDEASRTIFLVWRCPASGFLDATDTFVIDGATNKIMRQNVAFQTSS